MIHIHRVELPQLSVFSWCFPAFWLSSPQLGKQPLVPGDVAIDGVRVSGCIAATPSVQALVTDLQSRCRWGFQLGLGLLQSRCYRSTEGQARWQSCYLHPITSSHCERPHPTLLFSRCSGVVPPLPLTVTNYCFKQLDVAHRLEEKDRETISLRTSSTISVKDWIVEAPSDYGSTLLLLPSSFYFFFLSSNSNITFPMSFYSPVLSPFFISSSSSPADLLDKPRQGTEVSPNCAWDISSKRFFSIFKQNFPFMKILPIFLQSYLKETSLPKRLFWCCIIHTLWLLVLP